MADQKKKPLLSRKAKRIVLFFGLLLAFPAVLAGALTPQNVRQEAATPSGRPDIIVIEVQNQPADSIDRMQTVKETLGSSGMTFTNAYVTEPFLSDQLAAALIEGGYTAEKFSGASAMHVVTAAQSVLDGATGPVYLHLLFATDVDSTVPDCDDPVTAASPSINEADVSDKPRSIRAIPRRSDAQLNLVLARKQAQLCSLGDIDTAIGQLTESLGEKRENTMIIYTSTSGYAWGEHRIVGNSCLYDACRHVPFIMSYPAFFKTSLVSRELVQTPDITPTVLQLVGITEEQSSGSGVSLVPLFTRPDVPVHEQLFFIASAAGTTTSVRTKEFLYIDHGNGEREFYDLVADPLELTNQINAAVYRSAIDRLSREVTPQK